MTFFWVDERCVSPEHQDSNYGLARRELLGHVPATHFFRMRGEEDPVEAAANTNSCCARTSAWARRICPAFDFMLLGMGEDGHTGSIFPTLRRWPNASAWSLTSMCRNARPTGSP